METTVTVNGIRRKISADRNRRLLEVLREELRITGPKLGCGEGVCGACTVLVGRRAVTACITTVGDVAGQDIRTVEGLAEDGILHPVQQAWLETGAMQCGYCTPGWLVGAAALLDRVPHPDDRTIAAALAGHVCRCGTYPRILRAVRRAAELLESPDLLSSVPTRQMNGSALLDSVSSGCLAREGSGSGLPVVQSPGKGREGEPPFLLRADGLLTVAAIGAAPDGLVIPQSGIESSAWVYVGADGSVIAFTGKVEAGQGTRTAIALMVAEELSVAPDAVSVVMADTSISPFDPGTFGSRSMARAGPPLRAAAAAGRTWLLKDAGQRLGVPVKSLTVADGVVMTPDGAAKVSYAELLTGVRRLERVPRGQALKHAVAWQTAGRATAAVGAVEMVTGRKQFPADLAVSGMLHGCALHRPAAAARMTSADTAGASQMPGVTVVRDGSFVGVVASDEITARQAMDAVAATWEIPPHPGKRDLWTYLRSHPDGSGESAASICFEQGDVTAALASDPAHIDATYSTDYIAHVPLEPRSALASWRDGKLTVRTGTSMPFANRQELGRRLDLPESHIQVIVPDYGGGFGGKHGADVAIEAAILSRAVGRPVKVQWTREEEFRCGYLRPAALIDVAASISDSGKINGWSFTNINAGPAGILSPYRIPHQRIVYQPACSPLPQGAYRAMAATANHFARESHMDDLATLASADPLEFRLQHLADGRLGEVFCAAADRLGWPSGRDLLADGLGVGIAGGIEKGGRVATAAAVTVDSDGSVKVDRLVTAFDCGAIVNPDNLANQVEGAIMMGLGGALFETINFSHGRILNASMAEYRIPRLTDLPQVDVLLMDRPNEPSAGGGETPIVSIAPAIANAIYAARHVRLRSMPLAPNGRLHPAF